MRVLSSLLLMGAALAAHAADDWALLGRATQAGRSQVMTGTYLHQMNGSEVETFRIFRGGTPDNVLERRESMDGPPREIVRNGESLTCHAPDRKALVAARVSAMRLFPAMIIEEPEAAAQSYVLKRTGTDRVAQRDCTMLDLKPRDKLRYGMRVCVDQQTAMPLKLVTYGPKNDIVEMFTFTEVDFAAPHDRSLLKPHFKLNVQLRSAQPAAAEVPASRVEVSGMPPGFKMVRSVRRQLTTPAGERSVPLMVFSDGVVMLSLFVEPVPQDARPDRVANFHGAVSMATGVQGDQLLTLVGDLPESTLSGLVRSIRVVTKP